MRGQKAFMVLAVTAALGVVAFRGAGDREPPAAGVDRRNQFRRGTF
jgi:hypothetical protein